MGWQKEILRVNLSEGTATKEPLNMSWAHDYLGERGLATKYLYEEMDPAADPMGPQNVLIFAQFHGAGIEVPAQRTDRARVQAPGFGALRAGIGNRPRTVFKFEDLDA